MVAIPRFSFPDEPSENVVEAEAFILKDKSGKQKAALFLDDLGSPQFVMQTDTGRQFVIGTWPDGSIYIATVQEDESGPSAGLMIHANDVGTAINVCDPDGKSKTLCPGGLVDGDYKP